MTLKRYLWATIRYNLDVIEDDDRPHALKQKASHALVQAAMGWLKATEAADILPRLERLEAAAAERNGHHEPY